MFKDHQFVLLRDDFDVSKQLVLRIPQGNAEILEEILGLIESISSGFDLPLNGVGFVVVLQVNIKAVDAWKIPNEVILALHHIDLLILIIE